MSANRRKTIYYTDALKDDFAGTEIKQCEVDEDYEYIKRSPVWRAAALVVYRFLATPIVWLVSKVTYGLRIKNRRALRALRGKGFYMYGNHTNAMIDAFSPTLVAFPHRAHIIANADAVSIKGIRQLVAMLGAIPVPTSLRGMRPFRKAVEERCGQNRAIAIYPEAHIWPYYTGVRPFANTSFSYPVKQNAPCVAFVTTYRRRWLLKNLPPKMTITLSEPFLPDASLPEQAARQKLRDEIYAFMCQRTSAPDNYAYYNYVRREAELPVVLPEAESLKPTAVSA